MGDPLLNTRVKEKMKTNNDLKRNLIGAVEMKQPFAADNLIWVPKFKSK